MSKSILELSIGDFYSFSQLIVSIIDSIGLVNGSDYDEFYGAIG